MSNAVPTPRDGQPPVEGEHVEAVRLYVRQLKAFWVHASMFGAGMTVIFAVNLATNLAAGLADEWSAWWSAWAFLGWGLGIATHGLVVRLNRPARSTASWEERQIDTLLDR